MPKAKKITFDPVAQLKTLPQEFWLKVPTYDDKFRCDILQDYEYVDGGKDRRGYPLGQKSQYKRPDACELFPQYAEFFDKFVNIRKAFCLRRAYRPTHDDKPIEEDAKQDWVEYVIGEFRFRYNSGREFTHASLDRWHDCNRSWQLFRDDDYKITPLGKKFNSAEKKVANTWNRLRKKARRDAGLDLSAQDAVKAKAKAKAKLVKKETKLCADHIDAMIEALQEHKAKVLTGEITREETGYIFDMTNEMTARNAALRDALGNS